MKILISAFACVPNGGSEGGAGWRWAQELSRNHDVVVITDESRRKAIEDEIRADSNLRIKFFFFRPYFLRKIPLNSVTAQCIYLLWQFSLISFARGIHRREKFDLVMHLTYGVFRHPSFLGYLGVPFVFGPVGGGEDAPFILKRSIRGMAKLNELMRTLINKLALIDPFLWMALRKTSLIIVRTEETRDALPWPFRKRAMVFQEIGVDSKVIDCVPSRSEASQLRVMFAGRLLGLKGIHLAMRAVAVAVRRGCPCHFTIVGDGPYEKHLRTLEKNLDIEGRINWIKRVPQQDLFRLYGEMHCFLFPSLHESGGNVVLEAQAFGLPVICLDLGGPRTLVDDKSAIIVSTSGKNEDDVVADLADAIIDLAKNEERRFEMGRRGYERVRSVTWGSRVDAVMSIVEKECFGRA